MDQIQNLKDLTWLNKPARLEVGSDENQSLTVFMVSFIRFQ